MMKKKTRFSIVLLCAACLVASLACSITVPFPIPFLSTLTPTATPTPLPSATPSPLPTETPSSTEPTLVELDDGSFQYRNPSYGFSITVPPHWIIVSMTGMGEVFEEYDLLLGAASQEPFVLMNLTIISDADPDDLSDTDMLEDAFLQTGMEVISSRTFTTSNFYRMVSFKIIDTSSGAPVYEILNFLDFDGTLMMILFGAESTEALDNVTREIAGIIDSIAPYRP